MTKQEAKALERAVLCNHPIRDSIELIELEDGLWAVEFLADVGGDPTGTANVDVALEKIGQLIGVQAEEDARLALRLARLGVLQLV